MEKETKNVFPRSPLTPIQTFDGCCTRKPREQSVSEPRYQNNLAGDSKMTLIVL